MKALVPLAIPRHLTFFGFYILRLTWLNVTIRINMITVNIWNNTATTAANCWHMHTLFLAFSPHLIVIFPRSIPRMLIVTCGNRSLQTIGREPVRDVARVSYHDTFQSKRRFKWRAWLTTLPVTTACFLPIGVLATYESTKSRLWLPLHL